jgi:hypothetical protein
MSCGHNDLTPAIDAGVHRICACAQHSQGNHDHQHKTAGDAVAARAKEQAQCPDDAPGDCGKGRVQADGKEQSNAHADRSHQIRRRTLPEGRAVEGQNASQGQPHTK